MRIDATMGSVKLKNAISTSKRRSLLGLCDDAEVSPWGTAYKVVMKKLNAHKQTTPQSASVLRNIVSTLFPKQPEFMRTFYRMDLRDPLPVVTAHEVLKATSCLQDGKSPGPDGIPNVALKCAVKHAPDTFADVFTACLAEGIFPDPWKVQKLVLILKPGKKGNDPSVFRPICMLDTVGKIFEKGIGNRITKFVKETGVISFQNFWRVPTRIRLRSTFVEYNVR